MGNLTTAFVRTQRTPGRYLDGHGLILEVKAPERRYWMHRYQRDGRERWMSLGNADLIQLGEARRLHTEARALLAKGLDPLTERARQRQPTHSYTFAEVAMVYIERQRPAWRGFTAKLWEQILRNHAFPVFGNKPIGEVNVEDVLKALHPIWTTKTQTAQQLRTYIHRVISYAQHRDWHLGRNPARWDGHLQEMLPDPKKIHTIKNHPALPWQKAPEFWARLTREEVSMTGRCIAFIMLTAARCREAREATWHEIDLTKKLWTIPAHRTKAGTEHRVPLSKPAVELLKVLALYRSPTNPLIFPGRAPYHSAPSNGTLLQVMDRLGCPEVTTHGFRTTFRTWVTENGKPWEVGEASLSHKLGSKVALAYMRSDLLDLRRTLMEEWAAYLTGATGTVVEPPTITYTGAPAIVPRPPATSARPPVNGKRTRAASARHPNQHELNLTQA